MHIVLKDASQAAEATKPLPSHLCPLFPAEKTTTIGQELLQRHRLTAATSCLGASATPTVTARIRPTAFGVAGTCTTTTRILVIKEQENLWVFTEANPLEHVAAGAKMAPTSPTKGDHRWQQYRKAFTP